MAQVAATVFLGLIILGVAKMIVDVQMAKLKRLIDDLKNYIDEY